MLNKALFALALVMCLCMLASPALSQSAPAPAPAPAPAAAPARGATGVEAAPEPRPGSPSAAPAAGQTSPNQPNPAKLDGNNRGAPPENPGLFGGSMWPVYFLIGALLLMFLLSSRSRRKQEAKRKELLGSMKKGDRVTTIGGIIGTLIEVRDTEVVVKVDEQNNTRLRFLRTAIAHVGEPQSDKEQQKKD